MLLIQSQSKAYFHPEDWNRSVREALCGINYLLILILSTTDVKKIHKVCESIRHIITKILQKQMYLNKKLFIGGYKEVGSKESVTSSTLLRQQPQHVVTRPQYCKIRHRPEQLNPHCSQVHNSIHTAPI